MRECERERQDGVMHNKVFDDNSSATDSYSIMSVKLSLGASNGKISHATTHKHSPSTEKLTTWCCCVMIVCYIKIFYIFCDGQGAESDRF